jgi:hypothetical protein
MNLISLSPVLARLALLDGTSREPGTRFQKKMAAHRLFYIAGDWWTSAERGPRFA